MLGYSLNVTPEKHFLNWQQDPYGNWVARLVFPEPTEKLEIVVDVTADMTVVNPFDFFVDEYAEGYPFRYKPELAKELIPFLETAPPSPRLAAWIDAFRRTITPGESTVLLLVRLNQQLQHEIKYLVRMQPGVQTPDETLGLACGSCRDTGWLLVQIMRHLGIAARFASGYLIQLVADVKPLDGPAGTDHDFTDLHAWAEAYLPGAGWVGLDPTSGLLAGEGHLPLACTADPGSAAPVIGFSDPCEVQFEVNMRVVRVHEDPRVTKPYTDAQWQAIDALGEQVDAELLAHDVRLTQGGEPTFVSVDDMDGPEWNYLALSPKKLALAQGLQRRLAGRFASGPLLHSGQGKWYPGEPLPRWALGIYWRADGEPLWRDAARSRRHRGAGQGDTGRCPQVQRRARRGPRPAGADAAHRVRGRPASGVDGDGAAGQCRPDARRSQATGGTRAAGAAAAGGTRDTRRFRAAAACRAGRRARCRLGIEPVAAAPRATVRAAQRFTAGPAPAAWRPCPTCCPTRPSTSRRSTRSRRASPCRRVPARRPRAPARAVPRRARSSRRR